MTEDQATPRGAQTGRVAVVVGGASGIGRTVAKALARQGARVVVADFDNARMERTVEEILHLGTSDSALALPTDVRNDASVRAMAEDAIKAMGRVDVLLNMAGVLLQGRLEMIKSSDWRWMLETNLLGPIRTCVAFLPHMLERRSGHIVNTVSGGGLAPRDPLTIAYDTGQVALASYTRSLAAELEGSGVAVSLFSTGRKGPRIGQNTRSRGLGRLLHATADLEEGAETHDQLVDTLVDALSRPTFLIHVEPGESDAMEPAPAQ